MNTHGNPQTSKEHVLLSRLAGDRSSQMVELIPTVIRHKVESALAQKLSDDDAYDVAFHLTDWNGELAFLRALYLFPEEFSSEEVMEGVEALLIHAPNHLAAAAQLLGYPVTDVFDSGVTPWPEQRNIKPKNER